MNCLVKQMSDVVAQLVASGFTAPMHIVVLDMIGNTITFRYVDNDQGTFDTEIIVDGQYENMVAPINMMFVSSTGEAANVVIEEEQMMNMN